MKHTIKFLSKLLFVLSIFLIQTNFSSALQICPGQPATLSWDITSGTVTDCKTKLSNNLACPFDSSDANQGQKSIRLPSGSCRVDFQCQNGTKADGTPNYSNVGSDTLNVYTGTALGANNCCTVGTNLANGTTVYVPTYGEWGNWIFPETNWWGDGGPGYWQPCAIQDPNISPQLGCYREEVGGSCTAPILPATGSVTGTTCTLPTGASSCINTLTWNSVNNL